MRAADSPAPDVVVRPFESADTPAVVALLRRAFGRWPRVQAELPASELFAWKHLSSPFGASRMLVAQIDSATVGFIARMPWRLSFGGDLREAVRVVDIAVDPSVRRRGVAMRLIGTPRSHYGPSVALSWSNPNEQSRRGAEKAGLVHVRLRQHAGLGSLRGALVSGHDRASATDSARTLLADDALLARVLDRGADPRAIETALDERFLRWRYARFDVYRALAVADRRGRAALAIFRVGRHGRWSVAHVCELLAQERRPELARRALRAVRRASGAALLTVATPPGGGLALAGVARSPRAREIAVNVLHDKLEPDPTASRAWSVSLGDLELI